MLAASILYQGLSAYYSKRGETIAGKPIIYTIIYTAPLDPKNLIDAILLAPCTGSILSKMANAIIDTPVVLAIKATMIGITVYISMVLSMIRMNWK